MPIDKVIITLIGTLGIVFTYWFFLGKKEEEAIASGTVDITVEGGYKPSQITIPVGKEATVNFTRRDPNPCLEEIVLSDFKIRKSLPLGEKVSITVKPEKSGEYSFTCGMNMFHGKLIAR